MGNASVDSFIPGDTGVGHLIIMDVSLEGYIDVR
jgi:hypothetical protein